MGLNQYYINGNVAYQLFSKPEANAVYCLLTYYCSNRFIIYKKTTKNKKLEEVAQKIGIGRSTLIKQIAVLKDFGIIEENTVERHYRILSNKEITEKFGAAKSIYAPSTYDYKKLKLFFKNIQFYSNLSSQSKEIKKKEHYNTIIGKFHFGVQTKAETTKLKRLEKKCNVSFDGDVKKMYECLNFTDKLQLSNETHAKLINRKSKGTAFNHKRKLSMQDDRLTFERQYSKGIKCSLYEHYDMIESGELPPYAKHRNGYSYYDLATKFMFDKDKNKPELTIAQKLQQISKKEEQLSKSALKKERYLADTHNLIG